MNRTRTFLLNEYSDYCTKFNQLEGTYHPKKISEEKARFDSEFNKLVAVVTSSFRKMIAEFTHDKHEKVKKMVRTAPTEPMRNLLETLKLRDDLDLVELHDVLPMVFENYQGLRALQVIARQNGITLNTPVQMNCADMHSAIDRAAEYLNSALDELVKPKSKVTHYNDFFTVNDEEKDKIYSPVYEEMVALLDTVP